MRVPLFVRSEAAKLFLRGSIFLPSTGGACAGPRFSNRGEVYGGSLEEFLRRGDGKDRKGDKPPVFVSLAENPARFLRRFAIARDRARVDQYRLRYRAGPS